MKIQKFPSLPSTSTTAKELALEGTGPWTIIVAEEQTGGYGRKSGRSWFSPKGGLYFTIILPKTNIEDLQTLTILAGFIVAKVIKENFDLEPFIKLPNDVWINGKKVAGVLTENVIGKKVKCSVIGIGLNTNIDKFPKDFERKATSIQIELGQEVDNEKILKQIVDGLKYQLKVVSE